MEIYIIIGLVILALALLSAVGSSVSSKRKVFKDNVYSYTAKSLPMTRTEADFFMKLERAVSERYYVFPQVHLSAILDHTVIGQDWKYAFRHINGKSVDFVLCDRETLRPFYAIELDDYTHAAKDRIKRDQEVERIFKAAHLPLVRFTNKDVSEEDIVKALMSTSRTS